ncbi:MAG: diadenylate cyclase CdaA [Candidatus Kapaibacterium sp.]
MELFRIGFLSVTLLDLLDITLVAVIFYWVYKAMRDTIAVQILFGLVILIGLQFITEAVNLSSINWILETIQDIWILAFIILFQPELRKMLLLLTRTPFFMFFMKTQVSESFDTIYEAVSEMSDKHIGALLVFPRTQNVKMTIDTGIPLQATLSTELLLSIFSTKSPLHDGAIVIDGNIIAAARCVLPLSSETKYDSRNLGTRHRAALGLTEQIDAVVLIVSEETGWISIADSGELMLNVPKEKLITTLKNKLEDEQETKTPKK